MNLWVINQFAASRKYSTGAGERHFYLAQEYLNKNIETTIFSGSYNHLFQNYPKFKGRSLLEIEEGIRFCWVKVPKYKPESAIGRILSWFWFTFNLFFIRKTNLPTPAIILVSSMSMFPILYALFYKINNPSVKLIFEIRDIWPLTLLEMGTVSRFNPVVVFMKIVEKAAYRYSNLIVSVLPMAYKHINKVAKREVDFTWIPNGISLKLETENKLPDSLKHLFPKDKFVITYAGAIGPANAMEFFAEAIEKLENESKYHINIIGEGPEKNKIMDRLKEKSFVHFIKRIKKEEVQAYLKKSDLLYIGWRNKSLYKYGVAANKYNDYMLAKKPILSSSSFPNDIVSLANCGKVVASESPVAIKQGIEYFYNLHNNEITKLGNNGYEYLMNNRLYKILANQYLNCFNRLLKND